MPILLVASTPPTPWVNVAMNAMVPSSLILMSKKVSKVPAVPGAVVPCVGGFAPGLLRHPEYRLADGIIADDFLDLGVGIQPRPQ
jgi:hypothetical protein